MGYLALDVSAASTGWAVWIEGDIRSKFDSPDWPKFTGKLGLSATSKNWRVYDGGKSSVAHGAWRLKTEWSKEGEPHAKLHDYLTALHDFCGFEHIFFERALAQSQRGDATNQSNDILVELIGHVKSFHFAYQLRRLIGIHRASWQKAFIGSVKRGTKRATITQMYSARARQLGFAFRKDDEAAALGLLSYGLLTSNIQPPWLANEVLQAPLVIG